MVTGGTGSFGQEFTQIALQHNPEVIRIFSRGEHLQQEMERRFNDNRLRFFIGDIRDKDRLWRAMDGVDIVIHAAALKCVPVAEYNPREAILTNINGTLNVVDTAIDRGVGKVIGISSDKAVHPVNLYGATKACMEKLFVQANVYTSGTRFSCVRYGNVVASKGSVILLWREQRKTGELEITDERMTRFWIPLEQGVDFVISCIEAMVGGEVFIPKIPSMRITDLAEVIAPECQKRITGIRPGEKLHEVLLTEEESKHTREFENYFVITPEFPYWTEDSFMFGGELPEGFRYSSNSNSQWLSREDLEKIISEIT